MSKHKARLIKYMLFLPCGHEVEVVLYKTTSPHNCAIINRKTTLHTCTKMSRLPHWELRIDGHVTTAVYNKLQQIDLLELEEPACDT